MSLDGVAPFDGDGSPLSHAEGTLSPTLSSTVEEHLPLPSPATTATASSDENVNAGAVGGGASRALRLYTHNVYFLPTIARIATCKANPVTTMRRDLDRAEWLSKNIIEKGYDIVCLQEVFREGPRRVVTDTLGAHGYHVVSKFNDSLAFITNSGLFFASKAPIIHSDFAMFNDADASTPDYLSRKGVALCVVQTAPREFVAVFLTHTQAEYCAYEARKAQTVQAVMFMTRKMRELEATLGDGHGFQMARTAVLFAGDMNVDETFCPMKNGMSFSELENMVALLHHPHDLHRLKVGEGSPILTFPSENSRLDYIFSWNVCHPEGGGELPPRSPREFTRTETPPHFPAQPSTPPPAAHPVPTHDTLRRRGPHGSQAVPPEAHAPHAPTPSRARKMHLSAAYTMYALAAGVSLIALVPATVLASLGALIHLPAPRRDVPCLTRSEADVYRSAKKVLGERTAAVCLLDCHTEEDLFVAPNHPASDHHPIILTFEVHTRGCCGRAAFEGTPLQPAAADPSHVMSEPVVCVG